MDLSHHLDQLYAALPSETKPSFPVDTVAFSKCRMFIEDLEDVTIIKMESQFLRKSCSTNIMFDWKIQKINYKED